MTDEEIQLCDRLINKIKARMIDDQGNYIVDDGAYNLGLELAIKIIEKEKLS